VELKGRKETRASLLKHYTGEIEVLREENLKMSRFRSFFIITVLVGCPIYAQDSGSARIGIPSMEYRRATVHATPVWLSSDAAFDQNGELRPDLFSDVERSIINANREQNGGGQCVTFLSGRPLEDYRQADSVDSLTANALSIINGVIVARSTGFYNGVPGTLLAVRVTEAIKAFSALTSHDTVFLFFPEATIPTQRGLICSRAFAPVPLPELGDGIIAFATLDPIDAQQRFVEVDPHTQLIVAHHGKLSEPAATKMRADGTRSPHESLGDLARDIKTSKHLLDVPPRIQQ